MALSFARTLTGLALSFLATGCSSSQGLRGVDSLPKPRGVEVAVPAAHPPSTAVPSHLLYLAQKGDLSSALELYNVHKREISSHDYSLLQQLGFVVIDSAARSQKIEDQLLSLYGAGITESPYLLYILEEGLNSYHPEGQMAALFFLSRISDDRATDIIASGMKSNYLSIRVEAAYHLAHRHQQEAPGQIESLMHKIPPEFRAMFPPLFAIDGSPQSIRMLRRMIASPEPAVANQAVLSAAENGYDHLLPQIRSLANHVDLAQLEVCAFALGRFKDESSAQLLETLIHSSSSSVRVSAGKALHSLGHPSGEKLLTKEAEQGNPYAIFALGTLPGSADLLFQLIHDENRTVRLNATLALLELRDARALVGIEEILLPDPREIAFLPHYSTGNSLLAFRAVPSAGENLKNIPYAEAMNSSLREKVLIKTLALGEESFLRLAEKLFYHKQKDLVPSLVRYLESLGTKKAKDLLRRGSVKVGAPLIRGYCNLALFRLNAEEPYEKRVTEWTRDHLQEQLIRFRPMMPWKVRQMAGTPFELTVEENSRLLVESYEALAQKQSTGAIEELMWGLAHGNPRNRAVLAGLLIRATE